MENWIRDVQKIRKMGIVTGNVRWEYVSKESTRTESNYMPNGIVMNVYKFLVSQKKNCILSCYWKAGNTILNSALFINPS